MVGLCRFIWHIEAEEKGNILFIRSFKLENILQILKIIHGYPPRYNAGSEVYSRSIVRSLVENDYEVYIFSRYENPFEPDFSIRIELDFYKGKEIPIHLINIARSKDRYRHQDVDNYVEKLIVEKSIDIVHIGHLNHLSTSLISSIKKTNTPIVFTLHDYWLMCPRGQFLQFNIGEKEPYQLCEMQEDLTCAIKCYTRYISGGEKSDSDIEYWTSWVKERMDHVKSIASMVDFFIAPSRYLMDRFTQSGFLAENKITYLDYGFNTQILQGRERKSIKNQLVFGYIGTHIPAKGIQLLIRAFGKTIGNAKLIIWGRYQKENTPFLKEISEQLPEEKKKNITWKEEYNNDNIVEEVFNYIDCIIVPSIWVENSPLVIHEALEAGVCVITADIGGMKEYIQHGKNGLLFKHRNESSLKEQLQYLIDNPDSINKLSKGGYLYSENKHIPDIKEHVHALEKIYLKFIK